MALSNELISQFAKLVKEEKKPDNGTIVYGKIVVDSEGQKYVRLDGSDVDTPITENDDLLASTTDVQDGDRVSVMIKNHTATITGNISSPAARSVDVTQMGIVLAEKIQANEAYIETLQVDIANINELKASKAEITDLKAKDVEITGTLEAQNAEITNLKATKIDASVVEADYAKISMLEADYAKVRDLEAYSAKIEDLEADNVTINDTLKANTADIESIKVDYATIDFSNIKMAAVEKLFTESGIIKDLVVGDTSITGELVGVTLKGDLIEAGTLKADKLVVKGSDGIFYKLNVEAGGISAEEAPTESLHGSVITAKSITAEKVNVKDLVAFDATIGGFHITDNAIYSGAKASVDNTTPGIYQDSEGQFAVGDMNRYLKFYKEPNYQNYATASAIVVISVDRFIETAKPYGVSFDNDVEEAFDFRYSVVDGVEYNEITYSGRPLDYDTIDNIANRWGVICDGSNGDFEMFFIFTTYEYKLCVMADEIKLGTSGKSVETVIKEETDKAIEGVNDTINQNKEETDKAIADLEPVGRAVGNPIRIDDVSSVEHEMKVQLIADNSRNLIPYPYYHEGYTANGITFTINDDNTVTVNGTASATTTFYLAMGFVYKKGVTYTLSGCPEGGNYSTAYMLHSGATKTFDTGSGATFSFDADETRNIAIVVYAGAAVNNLVFKPQLEIGSEATEYEPYHTPVDFTEMVPKKNLIDITRAEDVKQNGAYITVDDDTIVFTYGTLTTNHFAFSCYAEVEPNTDYVLSLKSTSINKYYVYMDRLFGTAIKTNVDVNTGSFNSGNNTHVVIGFYSIGPSRTGTGEVVSEIMLEKGIVKTSYEPYQLIPAVQVSAAPPRKNLFDVDAYPLTSGYIRYDVGIVTDHQSYICTHDYVPCDDLQGQIITINQHNTGGTYIGLAFYSARLTYIRGIQGAQGYTGITVPNDAAYLRFTLDVGATDVQIELGSEVTEYEPFKHPTVYYANEDGSVNGVKSIYPITTLVCNNRYATIECEYNRNNTLGNDRVNQSNLEDRVNKTETSIANLTVSTEGINAEVQKLTEIQNGNASALDERIKAVEEKASMSMTESQVNIAIEKSLSENGASKVVTKTGYAFTDDGMIVQKSTNPEMKTQVSENGMEVSQNNVTTLKADNTGVDAKNLRASTYLIVGGRSRFQNYEKNGKKRTACFWLGG